MRNIAVKYSLVALSIVGSAILLSSCEDNAPKDDKAAEEALMTEYSEHFSIVESQNGIRSYAFSAPLVEGYSQAREPYREFRKGIKMITYKKDSLSTVDVVLTANYAINYEKRQLWEAKGNVVVTKGDSVTYYFQQLFWDARTKKIYSNLDSKMVSNNGRDVMHFEGFETDEEFKDPRIRRGKQHMEVKVNFERNGDSTHVERPVVERPKSRKPVPTQRTTKPRKPIEKTMSHESQLTDRPMSIGMGGQNVAKPALGDTVVRQAQKTLLDEFQAEQTKIKKSKK